MGKIEVINIVKKYAENLKKKGMSFDAVYLFGSYVKGVPRKWSDIDVAVISPYLRDKYSEGRFLLWKLTRDVDLRIEPHGFTPEGWADEANPVAHEIKNTGLKIA